MKANMALPAITLLLCLIIGNSSVSLAGDSGEERTIPVIEWGCWSCNKRVFYVYSRQSRREDPPAQGSQLSAIKVDYTKDQKSHKKMRKNV